MISSVSDNENLSNILKSVEYAITETKSSDSQ